MMDFLQQLISFELNEEYKSAMCCEYMPKKIKPKLAFTCGILFHASTAIATHFSVLRGELLAFHLY